MPITVFVPAPESLALRTIKRGSGIVGQLPVTDAEDLRPFVKIDYEGNLYGAINSVTFADRVKRAWQRQEQNYPTVARMAVPLDELRPIGRFDAEAGFICELGRRERLLLADWLDVESLDPKQLRCTS